MINGNIINYSHDEYITGAVCMLRERDVHAFSFFSCTF